MLHVSAERFGAGALEAAVAKAASATWGGSAPAQVRYLAAYLADREVGARTMLVETPYIDRHYLQEYVGFYATKLHPPNRNATRIHFWKRAFDTRAWDGFIARAATDGVDVVQNELGPDYLGYVVVRPLAACPIGRTLLRTYAGRDSRCYAPATTSHEVHLQGLTFRVEALPFQQQDQGLGACATTALWSSLARATRADGGRAATPFDVARAATDSAGPLVAAPQGLDLDSMKRSFRDLGYVPHVFSPRDRDVFLLALKAYVRGGIAVVLRLRVVRTGELHAVAVAGMREHDEEAFARDLVITAKGQQVLATGLSRLYLHDDRLGPYARFLLQHPAPREGEEAPGREGLEVVFCPEKKGFEEYTDPMRVESAIVPLYPKVRTSAESLVAYAGHYLPLARSAAGKQRDALRVEPWFTMGGQYLAKVGEVLRDAKRLTDLRRHALLSRYVGVIRFWLPDGWLCDLVVDTTDVGRDEEGFAPILLAVGRDVAMTQTFERARKFMSGAPILVV